MTGRELAKFCKERNVKYSCEYNAFCTRTLPEELEDTSPLRLLEDDVEEIKRYH